MLLARFYDTLCGPLDRLPILSFNLAEGVKYFCLDSVDLRSGQLRLVQGPITHHSEIVNLCLPLHPIIDTVTTGLPTRCLGDKGLSF